jgi:hypothetical protein
VKHGLVQPHWKKIYVSVSSVMLSVFALNSTFFICLLIRTDRTFIIFGIVKGDAIQTVDDLLMNKIANGYDVYEVKYKPPIMTDDSILRQLLQPASTSTTNDGPIRSAVRWLVRMIATEVKAELLSSPDKNIRINDQYMAVDDTSDRVRSQMD